MRYALVLALGTALAAVGVGMGAQAAPPDNTAILVDRVELIDDRVGGWIPVHANSVGTPRGMTQP